VKKPLPINVYEAALERVSQVFDTFPNVTVSFSGGKDSGVLLNLALEEARRRGRLPLTVLFVDLEAQYAHTIEYVERVFRRDDVDGYWVCLPLNLRNSVSQHQPFWTCWEPGESWVREPPDLPEVVREESFFPFFRREMEWEEFMPAFSDWYSRKHGLTANLIGIRTDESINRFRTLHREDKQTWGGRKWTTRSSDSCVLAYPIYDWGVKDVWVANGKFGWDYNRTYDLMHQAGLTLAQMRLCQPYGDDQRRGLWLFKILEPITWARLVGRVQGANFGARHASSTLMAFRRAEKPEGMIWEGYAEFLLETMPPPLAEHYRRKIDVFLRWWAKKGFPEGVPDEADPKLESGKNAPSWRRIAKVLLRGDYWCKGLSFSMTKRERERQTIRALKYLDGRK